MERTDNVPSIPDYLGVNRTAWDKLASEYEAPGRRNWSEEPSWGIWCIPESDLRLLDGVENKDSLELGCGTGYVSSWLSRRGARPIGLDNSPKQLASARRLQREFGISFPLIFGAAEQVPVESASFDLIISEYGASIWSDPYCWIPEASRLLRSGGELIFLVNGTILMLCANDDEIMPAGDRLLRDYFGMHRFEWPDDDSVEFHLGFGDWVRLLRGNNFEIENFIELRPQEGKSTRYPFVSNDWSRRWPSEEIWRVRRK